MEPIGRKNKIADAVLQVFLRTVPIIPANEVLALLQAMRKTENDVGRQVDEALESLKNTAALVDRLETDLKSRMEGVKRLQEEHKKFSQLSQISQEQALALSDLISTTLGRNVRRERIMALLINIVAGIIVFILGVVFAAPVTAFFGGFFG